MSILPDLLSSWLGPIIGFILGLIPLILLHEFGHLIMAKVMGVWAREFGIGYPPRIMKLFRWQETDFTLNWLPFGGFVRMEGEAVFAEDDEEEVDPEVKEHSLYTKPPWKRVLIYLGGPMTNVLTAWLIAILIFATGIPQFQPVITEVVPDSPAAAANLQDGDVIVAVEGTQIENPNEISEEISKYAGSPTELTIERGGETLTITVTPRENPPEGEGAMGVMITGEEIPGELQRFSAGEALLFGTRYFANATATTVMLPVYIIRMEIPFRQARPVGVVGISQIAEHSVNESIEQSAAYPFLNVLLLLSISLGIFNLIPIPALDGGRILFSVVEAIRGKRLSPELEERIHMIALMVMVVLFVFVTILDIVMPVPLP
ncbi:MAG: M50 family metallopeptidase [Anaerolineae bacterium]